MIKWNDDADRDLRALMAGYQLGEIDAFDDLYRRLVPSLRRCLMALARDAAWVDDLLQETFLQLHRARHTYNPTFPVKPWALAIARHVFLMARRARGRRGDFDTAPVEALERLSCSGHERASLAKDRLARMLAVLSPGTRRAVILHHAMGFSLEEAGRRLGIREAAARLRVSRAVARLRRQRTAGRNGDSRPPQTGAAHSGTLRGGIEAHCRTQSP